MATEIEGTPPIAPLTPPLLPLVVSSKAIAAVAKWAGQHDDHREHLRMVLFAKGEYVACDGSRLVIVPVKYDGPSFGVSARHLAAAVAAQECLNRNARDLRIWVDRTAPGMRVVINLDGYYTSKTVDLEAPYCDPSVYPPYEVVIPTGTGPTGPVGYALDPQYMAAIAEVNIATVDTSHPPGVRVVAWGGPLDPIMFENMNGVRFVIMPMRIP